MDYCILSVTVVSVKYIQLSMSAYFEIEDLIKKSEKKVNRNDVKKITAIFQVSSSKTAL